MAGKQMKKLGLMIVVLVGLGLGVRYLLTSMAAPSIGVTASPSAATSAKLPSVADQKTIHIANQYAAYDYPDIMKPSTLPPAAAPELYTALYTYRDASSLRLAITVRNLASPGLKYDSSYSFRKAHPDQYSETQIAANGLTFAIMTDKTASGFGKVAYTTIGMKAAEISLAGHSPDDPSALSRVFDSLVTSWRWQ